jgi:hypothetical protein
MPTTRRPRLNYKSLSFEKISKRILEELRTNEPTILDTLGFYREFGDPKDENYTGSLESYEVLREIAGVLATTAVIRVDAGYQAAGKLIATLNAIVADPELAFLDTVEAEARGALAAEYQRFLEPSGIFWMDLEAQDLHLRASAELVRAAARRAIAKLELDRKPGRRIAHDVRYVASHLREIFLRFNDRISRTMVLSSRGRGQYFQKEEGPFFLFLERVLAPLNRLLEELLPESDVSSRPVSAESIVKHANAVALGQTVHCPIVSISKDVPATS